MCPAWQDRPSIPRDSRRTDSRDVSPQPECIKRRPWLVHQPKARKDDEWYCAIPQRGRDLLLHNSCGIPAGSADKQLKRILTTKNQCQWHAIWQNGRIAILWCMNDYQNEGCWTWCCFNLVNWVYLTEVRKAGINSGNPLRFFFTKS